MCPPCGRLHKASVSVTAFSAQYRGWHTTLRPAELPVATTAKKPCTRLIQCGGVQGPHMLEEHLAAGADLSLEHALSVQSSARPVPHPAPQAAGVWCTPAPSSSGSEDLTRRCRHAVSAVGPYVFMFGGLRGSTLLDDFLLADDSSGTELSVCDPRSPAW